MTMGAPPAKQPGGSGTEEMPWIDVGKNYALGIKAGKLVCRNPAGNKLASVPKELKESELADQLQALCDWLADHRTECLRRVELWMLRSLPVPCDVVRAVWPDPDWSDMLRNLVVTPADAQGRGDATRTGLLRDIDAKKGIGVVDRDGETQWIADAQLLIPHPILIDGLVELREIAADLGFSQAIEQLFRPTFAATKEQADLSRVMDFNGGRFEQLNFASSTCRQLGYPVRGGYACSKIWEDATPLEARYWIGDDSPESETYTGELIFVGGDQKPLRIAEVGRVTFSEGVRMASRIYAKRKVEKEVVGGDA
ncbi:protein of unknown function [Singulisphaera sp. GP187]|uniref:DUF4132 domain-containing protein n=1 Tax=Singulisphaera sp. GP187 TaxID=1882752 RepID=UPI00092A800D|nr:DUF4132 domain-containing protein [Singulisphaera sp. GP187]SIO62722.1 protein of unknown function [Singulisphaera sp. GP187]